MSMARRRVLNFLNNTRIELQETELKEGDIITIIQMGSSNTVFRTSAEYIYRGGKIEELTEELKLQLEEEVKKGRRCKDSDRRNKRCGRRFV